MDNCKKDPWMGTLRDNSPIEIAKFVVCGLLHFLWSHRIRS
jgi:hypothetical protein